MDDIKTAASNAIDAIINFFTTTDWGAVGSGILQGIADGITAGVQWLVDAAVNAAKAAYDAAKGFLGIDSPSKLFFNVGENMMQGMALGINRNARLPAVATANAAAGTVNNNNFNMNVHTNAQSSTVTRDFMYMKALAG